MNLQGYQVLHDDKHEYYFFLSSGERGIIKKFIIYQNLNTSQYNLAFGDWDEKKLILDDSARSNNGDRNKVLATVSLTIADFLKFHPDSEILIKGSTPARTRLYQMGLNKYWSEIEHQFIVKGNTRGNWENFKKEVAYEAFAIKAKNSKFNKISFMAASGNKKDKNKKMILVKNMPDLRNDPFLKKKKEDAIEFLKKSGPPFAEKKK